MTTALVIHGHFYQPPRENPWTDLVEREPGAQPFHDWNERIHGECYRPNGYARIVDAYGRVERVVNNYSNLSFNFGPTLLSWLERRSPETYARIIEADRESVRRRAGHGNAVAQGYHHAILPLCNERDRRTQVRWGVSDFRRRFGRDPESLWLPETACDPATLETLIEEGLRYVILSPFQAERVRPVGTEVWASVVDGGVDTTRPYKFFHRDGTGRSLAIFFYDGSLARGIAFEGLLASSRVLLDRCERAAAATHGAQLVNVATDGESYGHHYRWGDRCLAYALETEAEHRGFRVTNYGEFLDEHEPVYEVEISRGPDGAGTAWSCAHGLGRWGRDCGCNAGAPEGWNQKWRTPLRTALDFLRDDAARKFEEAGGELFLDPWAARDAYVELLTSRTPSRESFLRRHAPRPLNESEQVRALSLLEAQRCAMVMYTSCGWFFDDISGIETVQVLRYAARAIELLDELELSPPLSRFLEILSAAESNVPSRGNGADIFRRTVETSRVTPQRVAAHLAVCNLVEKEDAGGEECESAGYAYRKDDFRMRRHGRVTLATTRLTLEAPATGRRHEFALAAMHFGDVDYYCALKPSDGAESFNASAERLWSQFRTASLPRLLRLAQDEFGPGEFGLEALLPEGQGQLSASVFGKLVNRFMDEYEYLYEENRRVVERLQEIGFHPPAELRAAAELTISRRLEAELRALRRGAGDPSKALDLAGEAARLGYRVNRASVSRLYEETLTGAARQLLDGPNVEKLQTALALVELGRKLGLEANLERAQEAVYEALTNGRRASEELRELGSLLGLAPSLLAPREGAQDEPAAEEEEALL